MIFPDADIADKSPFSLSGFGISSGLRRQVETLCTLHLGYSSSPKHEIKQLRRAVITHQEFKNEQIHIMKISSWEIKILIN